jgi:peptide-methionine (S)-S-oxide reductase
VNAAPVLETATFGGGCFWCLEAVFERLPGVTQVVSGYAGGHVANPSYRAVCDGSTGHAEVIQMQFDPSVIRYEQLLEVFWQAHDPTTANRQGADVGTQYRSIILAHTPEQLALAEHSTAMANAREFDGKIVTEIVPLETFHRAEESHQDYFRRNPGQAYCQVVIRPKLAKLGHRGIVPAA